MADSNGGREASEGSLRTSRKVFEAILVVERDLLVVFGRNGRSFWVLGRRPEIEFSSWRVSS
jgi:hypothetical protein